MNRLGVLSVGQASFIHKTVEKMKQMQRKILARGPKLRNGVKVQRSEADDDAEGGAVVREAETRSMHGRENETWKNDGFLLTRAIRESGTDCENRWS